MIKIQYDTVDLTEQELSDAILEGKKKKHFHEKNKAYWQKLESPKGKTEVTELKKEKGIL